MKMKKIKAFCSWPLSFDVGINIYENDEVISGIDLTVKDAEKLITELCEAVKQSVRLSSGLKD